MSQSAEARFVKRTQKQMWKGNKHGRGFKAGLVRNVAGHDKQTEAVSRLVEWICRGGPIVELPGGLTMERRVTWNEQGRKAYSSCEGRGGGRGGRGILGTAKNNISAWHTGEKTKSNWVEIWMSGEEDTTTWPQEQEGPVRAALQRLQISVASKIWKKRSQD